MKAAEGEGVVEQDAAVERSQSGYYSWLSRHLAAIEGCL
jgi:hypothetical protein